jgi:hypothetical protein
MMRCPVCSEALVLRDERAAPVICGYCSQIMLRNMTSETLGELGRQRDDAPRIETERSLPFPEEWREFRGVL